MILKLVDLICFEVISPEMKPSEQFSFLKDKGFKGFNQINPEISFESLQEILKGRKENSDYDIDGIIVCQNQIYQEMKIKILNMPSHLRWIWNLLFQK